MNAYSTHRSAVWMSVAILCLLTATAVFADGPGPKPPKDYPKEPVTRRSPDPPPPSPEVKPDPKQSPTDPIIGPVDKPTPPPTTPKTACWWWISACILLLLLLFLLIWMLRRKKSTGYVTPPSRPAYPPVDQSPQQTRPDQY